MRNEEVWVCRGGPIGVNRKVALRSSSWKPSRTGKLKTSGFEREEVTLTMVPVVNMRVGTIGAYSGWGAPGDKKAGKQWRGVGQGFLNVFGGFGGVFS